MLLYKIEAIVIRLTVDLDLDAMKNVRAHGDQPLGG